MPVIDCDGGDSVRTPYDAKLNTKDVTLFVVAFADTDDNAAHGVVETFSNSPVTKIRPFHVD